MAKDDLQVEQVARMQVMEATAMMIPLTMAERKPNLFTP